MLEGDAEKDKAGDGMTAADLLSLLKQPVDAKADLAQSGVVDDKVGSFTPSAPIILCCHLAGLVHASPNLLSGPASVMLLAGAIA